MYFYRRTFFILENMGIMKIIARYEWRLLGRSQIFWFVGCISFISVILLHFFFQSNFVFESPWPLVGLPCAVPFLCKNWAVVRDAQARCECLEYGRVIPHV